MLFCLQTTFSIRTVLYMVQSFSHTSKAWSCRITWSTTRNNARHFRGASQQCAVDCLGWDSTTDRSKGIRLPFSSPTPHHQVNSTTPYFVPMPEGPASCRPALAELEESMAGENNGGVLTSRMILTSLFTLWRRHEALILSYGGAQVCATDEPKHA